MQLLPTPFIDLSAKVNTFDDRGFWGLAFDPNFATNGYVYMSYTYENAGNPNSTAPRTSRLDAGHGQPGQPRRRAAGDRDHDPRQHRRHRPAARTPPSADCIAADSGAHTLGALHFASDGTLFVGVGDGADGDVRRPELAARPGPRQPERQDPAHQHRRLGAARQPVLRRDELLALAGLAVRRPQPVRVRAAPGDRGDLLRRRRLEHLGGGRPRTPGTNFGWPCYEGTGPQPTYQAQFAQCAATAAELRSRRRSTPTTTAAARRPSAARSTPGTLYPQEYRGNFFFADYSGNFIQRVVLDDQHQPVSHQPFATDVAAPVSIAAGPDGMIYYLSFTTGEVRRIRFNGAGRRRHGDTRPTATRR